MYALCVSGAVNTQGFVWKFFMRYIYIFIHSFIHILTTDTCTAHSHCIRTPHTCTSHSHCILTHHTCAAHSHCILTPQTCTAHSHCILTPLTCTAQSPYTYTSHLYCPYTYTTYLTAHSHYIILTPDQHSDRPVLVSAFHLTAVQPRVTAADRLDVVN